MLVSVVSCSQPPFFSISFLSFLFAKPEKIVAPHDLKTARRYHLPLRAEFGTPETSEEHAEVMSLRTTNT